MANDIQCKGKSPLPHCLGHVGAPLPLPAIQLLHSTGRERCIPTLPRELSNGHSSPATMSFPLLYFLPHCRRMHQDCKSPQETLGVFFEKDKLWCFFQGMSYLATPFFQTELSSRQCYSQPPIHMHLPGSQPLFCTRGTTERADLEMILECHVSLGLKFLYNYSALTH